MWVQWEHSSNRKANRGEEVPRCAIRKGSSANSTFCGHSLLGTEQILQGPVRTGESPISASLVLKLGSVPVRR
jgi:hypothetical protein